MVLHGKDPEDSLVQTPALDKGSFHYPRLLEALANLALIITRVGAVTASLGDLCQALITHKGKNLFYKIPSNPTLWQWEDISSCPITLCLCRRSWSATQPA